MTALLTTKWSQQIKKGLSEGTDGHFDADLHDDDKREAELDQTPSEAAEHNPCPPPAQRESEVFTFLDLRSLTVLPFFARCQIKRLSTCISVVATDSLCRMQQTGAC